MKEINILNFFSIYVLWKVEDSDFVDFFEGEIKLKIHSQIKLPLSLARKFIIKYIFFFLLGKDFQASCSPGHHYSKLQYSRL